MSCQVTCFSISSSYRLMGTWFKQLTEQTDRDFKHWQSIWLTKRHLMFFFCILHYIVISTTTVSSRYIFIDMFCYLIFVKVLYNTWIVHTRLGSGVTIMIWDFYKFSKVFQTHTILIPEYNVNNSSRNKKKMFKKYFNRIIQHETRQSGESITIHKIRNN